MHTGSRVWPDLGKKHRPRHRTKSGKGSGSYWGVLIVCLDSDFSLLLLPFVLCMILVVHLTRIGIHHPQEAAWVWVGQGENFAVCPWISAFPSSPTQRCKPEPSDIRPDCIVRHMNTLNTDCLCTLHHRHEPWLVCPNNIHGFHLLNGLDWAP